MALRGQIVNLSGLGFLHQTYQIGGVGQIAIMHGKLCVGFMRVDINIIHPCRVET